MQDRIDCLDLVNRRPCVVVDRHFLVKVMGCRIVRKPKQAGGDLRNTYHERCPLSSRASS